QVGINDDFFELGGHSLLAVRMIYFIERNLQVSIPINIIFEFTTIGTLSKYIELQVETSIQKLTKESFKMIKI
ncbi:MAG: phosphopantetheine-binding protein, partial [Ginsengibacter sp.]